VGRTYITGGISYAHNNSVSNVNKQQRVRKHKHWLCYP